jgi:hypothetical protein
MEEVPRPEPLGRLTDVSNVSASTGGGEPTARACWSRRRRRGGGGTIWEDVEVWLGVVEAVEGELGEEGEEDGGLEEGEGVLVGALAVDERRGRAEGALGGAVEDEAEAWAGADGGGGADRELAVDGAGEVDGDAAAFESVGGGVGPASAHDDARWEGDFEWVGRGLVRAWEGGDVVGEHSAEELLAALMPHFLLPCLDKLDEKLPKIVQQSLHHL